MCISVDFTPRAMLTEPWDAGRNLITLPDELTEPFALRALRLLLAGLGVTQGKSGARCWCGELIELPPHPTAVKE
ncbi:hypothetical protein [Streptomyces caniscabiei]|uniref:hypothetical protein n=1 Tax=Streptomyces caniscabiei TaxID=2746961 RepID=UPI0007660AD7|nr:hypothetical protein [Streptomyces caniscabiei]